MMTEKKTKKEVAEAYFKMLSLCLLGGVEENIDKPPLGGL
jgi:hypothetical protein